MGLELKIIPVKPYVHMRYIPVHGKEKYCDMMRELSGANDKGTSPCGCRDCGRQIRCLIALKIAQKRNLVLASAQKNEILVKIWHYFSNEILFGTAVK